MGERKEKLKRALLFLLSHHTEDFYSRTFRVTETVHLCARCTGMIIGFFSFLTIELIFIPFFPWFYAFPLMLAMVVPAIADWTTQKFQMRESNNTLRFITGFLLGAAVPLIRYQREILLIVNMIIFSILFGILIIIFKK